MLELLAYPVVATALLFAALRIAWWLTKRVFVFRSNIPWLYTLATAIAVFPYLYQKSLDYVPLENQTARFPYLLYLLLLIVLRLLAVFSAAVRKNDHIHLVGADREKLRKWIRKEVRTLDAHAHWSKTKWDCPSRPVTVMVDEDGDNIFLRGQRRSRISPRFVAESIGKSGRASARFSELATLLARFQRLGFLVSHALCRRRHVPAPAGNDGDLGLDASHPQTPGHRCQ